VPTITPIAPTHPGTGVVPGDDPVDPNPATTQPTAPSNNSGGPVVADGYQPPSTGIDAGSFARSPTGVTAPTTAAPVAPVTQPQPVTPSTTVDAPKKPSGIWRVVSAPFRWPAKIAAKVSKKFARVLGWTTMAAGGGGGALATGVFLLKQASPHIVNKALHGLGLAGLLGPQSAVGLGVVMAAGFTVAMLLQAVAFLVAGKEPKPPPA